FAAPVAEGNAYASAIRLFDGGALAVEGSLIVFDAVDTDHGTGLAPGADLTGGGIEIQGRAGRLTLNDSGGAGNLALDTASDVHLRDGGVVDPASANDLIGTGGSGGLVSGVNGNVVL